MLGHQVDQDLRRTRENHVAAYHEVVAEPALRAVLVDEAADVTASEAHVRAVLRLFTALSYALGEQAVVLSDIFVRVDNREQASPDVFVVPGVAAGSRTVYSIPPEPVPAVTIEVLSPVNREPTGRAELESKRSLFSRIGVPLHLEIDPDEGFIAVWELRDGALARVQLCTTYSSDALGGVKIETPAPSVLHVVLPNGHDVLDSGGELARAERLEAKLRQLGVDPDDG